MRQPKPKTVRKAFPFIAPENMTDKQAEDEEDVGSFLEAESELRRAILDVGFHDASRIFSDMTVQRERFLSRRAKQRRSPRPVLDLGDED